ncbi:MAG: acyl-CoA thioesterase [Bacteroidales bacterium]|nr:acyl-CoA thioesterase [Bacteroidales bacterium]
MVSPSPPSSTPLGFRHSTPVQIRFTDIDQLEHVTNSVYQQYYDMGRMAYFDQVLGEPMDWKREGLVLVSLSLDFLSPIRLHHRVEVCTRVVSIGRRSVRMEQEIYNHTTGCVCSRSRSVMAACVEHGSRSVPVPARWVERMAAHEPQGMPIEPCERG